MTGSDVEAGDPPGAASLDVQAAARYLSRQTGEWTASDQAELDAWLIDPAHERAYGSVRGAWHAVQTHAASPELMALRGDALQRASREPRTNAVWHRAASRSWAAAALLLVLLLGLGLNKLIGNLGESSYRTPSAERREILLADHSRIALDERTSLRVRLTADARVVHLLEGQAQFLVAHDPRRPFLVEAGGTTITAVGTSFNVQYVDARMKLDMVEGKVVVAVAGPVAVPGPAAPGRLHPAAVDRTLDLVAGEELNVEPSGQTRIVRGADIEAAIAWRQGKIIFKDTPLGDAVRQLNRYSTVQLRIGDAALAQERISGVFDLGDTMVFAEAVQSSLPVVVRHSGTNLLLLSPAP